MWTHQWKRIILCLFPSITLCSVLPHDKAIMQLVGDEFYESVKHDLMKDFEISPDFAEMFTNNLKMAIQAEIKQSSLRQGFFGSDYDEEDYEDEVTSSTSTTEGPSPFNIVNGIYGILQGVGTLNPDRIFASTVNFFPPSQKETAQALINSALGKPVTFPTPTTTIPTTTKPTTTTKDEDDDYDYYEDNTTKAAVAAAAATPAASQTAAPVAQTNTAKPAEGTNTGGAVAAVQPTSASAVVVASTAVQDDEFESYQINESQLQNLLNNNTLT